MSIIKLPCGQKVMIDESNFLNVEDKFRNEVPEVRAALMSSILVDSEYTAKLVEQHDKLYGMMK